MKTIDPCEDLHDQACVNSVPTIMSLCIYVRCNTRFLFNLSGNSIIIGGQINIARIHMGGFSIVSD